MSNLTPCFQGEVQLLNWSETHNGGAKVILQLSDTRDLECFKLMTVKKGNVAGQRLAVVMVEIGDDENPVPQMRLSQQSALLCKDFKFQSFVEKRDGYHCETPFDREEQAVTHLRKFCGVASRAELDSNGEAGARFQQLLSTYLNF